MIRSSFLLSLIIVLSSFTAPPVRAQYIHFIQDDKADKKADKKERKQQRREEAEAEKSSPDKAAKENSETSGGKPAGKIAPNGEEVTFTSDKQTKDGDTLISEGYVVAVSGEYKLQADRVVYNQVTKDAVAEGNVIFDQGADQRVTAKRAELNLASQRGTFWDTTGFTNRTQTGEYIYFTAERVVKTGPATYELFNANITACEDVVPKWNFTAKRAELKMGDRLILNGAVFRIKDFPVFILPYAWIPSTRNGRQSGFLIPTTGSSNQKGRTVKSAYFQTLGESADITFRHDIYTSRGLGFGAEFRAQTDERSYMRLGTFTVKDRLFGEAGVNQGGTAFVAEGQQYLPKGWLVVGNVSLVSSLQFRQVFSDDISQVIDPRRESTFFANNNTGDFSFNFLASNETTRLFRPNRLQVSGGTDFDVKIRQAPQMDLTMYSRRLFERLPIYLSFDSSLAALKREESVLDNPISITPAAVQRLDFQPKLTVPLATFAGIAITPSLSLRQTFYTSSLDPERPGFDPERFAASPDDPRLNPLLPEYNPNITLYDRAALDPIIPQDISRRYAELTVDIRPPALEKDFLNPDGSRRFKHLIEPYITYRLIKGIGEEFNRIIRFDERDAIANTNEFEYAIVNRFYASSYTSDIDRKKRKRDRVHEDSDMEIVRPDGKRKRNKKADEKEDKTATPDKQQASETKPEADKMKLAKGEQAELRDKNKAAQAADASATNSDVATKVNKSADTTADDTGTTATPVTADDLSLDERIAASATNEDAPAQAYEFLTIKVAQKYFFDRTFGGALQPDRRNQFYPLNMLTGFNIGGRARSFSPTNLQVRYRPLASLFADLRMDLVGRDGVVRDLTLSGGFDKGNLSVSASWYLSRRINLDANRFEVGTFPGDQIFTTIQFGDEGKGVYGGTRIGYDLTDQLISDTEISHGRLRNSRSYIGYGFDCCGVQFNYNTFKAGLRNESGFSVTFSLAGLGSFGTDQFSQLGGGRGGRKRGKKNRSFNNEY